MTTLPFFLCILSGLLVGITQPLVIPYFSPEPLNTSPFFSILVFFAYVPLFSLFHKFTPSRLFLYSFISQGTAFLIILYWFYIPVVVVANLPIFLGILSILAISAFLAPFNSFAFLVARAFHSHFDRIPQWLVLTIAFSASEYLRNYIILGGFPWGSIAYGLYRLPYLTQMASLMGIYGLTVLVFLVNALCAHVLFISKRPIPHLIAVCLIISGWVFHGFLVLKDSPSKNTLRVAILQSNIDQEIKNDQGLYNYQILKRFDDLQTQTEAKNPDLTLWPETAWPFLIPLTQPKWALLPPSQGLILLGAVGVDYTPPHTRYFNSAFLIDSKQKLLGRVDKTHLVPFGEYVPWPFEGFVQQFFPYDATFSPGKQDKVVQLPLQKAFPVHMGITICYEGLFPEISRHLVQQGANLLIDLTNDAWYKVSSSPYQHLNMYIFRAIETGRSFVRSTNTGVSAYIDRFGYVHQPTKLNETVPWVADVPIETQTTLYVRLGDVLPNTILILFFIMIFTAFIGLKKLKTIPPKTVQISAFTLLLSTIYYAYFAPELGEGHITLWTLITIISTVIIIGAWTQNKKTLNITALFLIFSGLFFTYFQSYQAMVCVLLGFLVWWVARGLK